MDDKLQVELRRRLEHLLTLPENKYCADCNTKVVSTGTHITKVKSVTLDKWTPEMVAHMESMGNGKARRIYEAKVPPNYPRPNGDQLQLEQWIRKKYQYREFYSEEALLNETQSTHSSQSSHSSQSTHSTHSTPSTQFTQAVQPTQSAQLSVKANPNQMSRSAPPDFAQSSAPRIQYAQNSAEALLLDLSPAPSIAPSTASSSMPSTTPIVPSTAPVSAAGMQQTPPLANSQRTQMSASAPDILPSSSTANTPTTSVSANNSPKVSKADILSLYNTPSTMTTPYANPMALGGVQGVPTAPANVYGQAFPYYSVPNTAMGVPAPAAPYGVTPQLGAMPNAFASPQWSHNAQPYTPSYPQSAFGL